jgi:hypothetical protein
MRFLHFSWIPLVASAGASLVDSFVNKGTSDANRNAQEAANSANLALAREQFDYQKELNATQMQREDNAYQRKVADLEAAGLSRALALGGGASSSPGHTVSLGSTVAPQESYRSELSPAIQKTLAVRQMMQDYSMSKSQAKILEANAVVAANEAKASAQLPYRAALETEVQEAESSIRRTQADSGFYDYSQKSSVSPRMRGFWDTLFDVFKAVRR